MLEEALEGIGNVMGAMRPKANVREVFEGFFERIA